MEVEVKLPKPADERTGRPADTLPFVVAEKNGRVLTYDEDGFLRLDGRDEIFTSSLAEFLGIPYEIKVVRTSAVATTIEGGGE